MNPERFSSLSGEDQRRVRRGAEDRREEKKDREGRREPQRCNLWFRLPSSSFLRGSLRLCVLCVFLFRVPFGVTASLVVAGEEPAKARPEKQEAPAPVQKPAPTGIRFQPFAEAIKEGVEKKRVVVVYFTAVWCGYCRKMEVTTFADKEVETLAKKFVWTKIDIDKQPHEANLFGVRSVPVMALLNVKGEILSTTGGYQSADRMVKLLKENAGKAESPGKNRDRVLDFDALTRRLGEAGTSENVESAVTEAVVMLAAPERQGRAKTIKLVIEKGKAAWPALLRSLGDERLAVRAAAYDLLTEATKAELPFDAFLGAKAREKQVKAWQSWLAEHVGETGTGQGAEGSTGEGTE